MSKSLQKVKCVSHYIAPKKLISPKIDQDLPTNGIRPLLKIIGFVPIIERREKFYYAFLEEQ